MASVFAMTNQDIGDPVGLDDGLRDMEAKFQAQIDALKEQIEELSNKTNPTVSKQRSQNQKSQQIQFEFIQETERHYKKATIAKAIRFLVLLILTALIFGYQLSLYLDPEENKLSQSAIERINYMNIPYWYLYAGVTLSNLTFPYTIEIQNGVNNYTEYKVQYISYTDDFVYDSSIVNWTMIDFTDQDDGEEQGFLVPPYGATIRVGSSLSIYIASIAYETGNVDDDTDWDFTDELLQKLTNGGYYGLFWEIGTIEDIKDIDFIDLRNSYYNRWQQLQYTFVATINYYYMDLFEEINKIDKTNRLYYTITKVASILDEYNLLHVNWVDTPYWSYDTKLIMYPNPSGGGLKTTLTITQKTTFTDLLSNVGGIFSPINTFTLVVLLWTLFGIHSSKFDLTGIAPYTPLDYGTRMQIKAYLVHLGVLDGMHMVKEEDNDNKHDIIDRIQDTIL